MRRYKILKCEEEGKPDIWYVKKRVWILPIFRYLMVDYRYCCDVPPPRFQKLKCDSFVDAQRTVFNHISGDRVKSIYKKPKKKYTEYRVFDIISK